MYIKFECTISRFHEQCEQQQGICFLSIALHENATLADHGRRLQGQLCYYLTLVRCGCNYIERCGCSYDTWPPSGGSYSTNLLKGTMWRRAAIQYATWATMYVWRNIAACSPILNTSSSNLTTCYYSTRGERFYDDLMSLETIKSTYTHKMPDIFARFELNLEFLNRFLQKSPISN
jgi:hypothetical protein